MALDVRPQQFSRYLHGQIPDPPTLIRLARELGVTVDFLLTGQQPQPMVVAEDLPSYGGAKPKLVPVLTHVPAGRLTAVEVPLRADEHLILQVRGERLFALKVKGDSMEPELHAGDVIVVDPDQKPRWGDVVVVETEGERESAVKRLERVGGMEYFRPLNREGNIDVPRAPEHRIVGKVVRLIRSY